MASNDPLRSNTVEEDELGPILPDSGISSQHHDNIQQREETSIQSDGFKNQYSGDNRRKGRFGGLFSGVKQAFKEKVKTQHEQFKAEKRRTEEERRQAAIKNASKNGALPPWAGTTTDPDLQKFLREEILRISLNQQSFLHPLGSEVDFDFSMETYLSEAMAALESDPNLKTLRFRVVPGHLSEEEFWKLYFYRVSKVYAEGNHLRNAGEDAIRRAVLESEAELEVAKGREKGDIPPGVLLTGNKEWEMGQIDEKKGEFISDNVNAVDLDITKELGELGMGKSRGKNDSELEEEAEQWQNELKEELGDSFADFDPLETTPEWEMDIKAELHKELGLGEK